MVVTGGRGRSDGVVGAEEWLVRCWGGIVTVGAGSGGVEVYVCGGWREWLWLVGGSGGLTQSESVGFRTP